MPVVAIDRVIANSQDWHDVYSSMLYASLTGVKSNFLTSQKHGPILIYSIPSTEREQFVVSSRTVPQFFGYADFLKGKGYADSTELVSRNVNLDLARRLNVTRFIMIDPAYGYNAISAAPFAVAAGSYVLFVDRRTIDEVAAFFDERQPSSVIILGQVDRQVKDGLARFTPEVVSLGDRFSNNIAMVDRYLKVKPTRQVVLSNGEFIEAGIMSGSDPVVFIGKASVPESVQQYIKKSDIDVGILIGNELIGTAGFIRRTLGISVFVKFAQGARVPQGAISQVEDLDRFPMPRYDLLLEVTSIVYNKATRSLEVTYHNPTGFALYLKGTITVRGGAQPIVLGDQAPLFLDKGEYKTIVYTEDAAGQQLELDAPELTAELLTLFGEGPKALENQLQQTLKISSVEVKDDSAIEIRSLYYDKSAQKFFVTIENTGPVDVYVQPELIDLMINGEPVVVASDAVVFIKRGGTATIPITVVMEQADFDANPQIKVRAFYGQREFARIKVTEKTFPLIFGGGYTTYVIYGAIALLIIVILLYLGTKKKCRHCGHKNPRGRKHCEKCGQRL
jgi:hypothetical protein